MESFGDGISNAIDGFVVKFELNDMGPWPKSQLSRLKLHVGGI